MPLPLVADTLDAIPEPLRSAYVEKDGKYHLDADVPDVSGLKAAIQKEREDRRKVEKALEAAAAAAREQEVKDKGLLEVKQKWDAEQLQPLKAEKDRLEQQVRALSLEGPLKAKLGTRLVDERAVEAVWALEAGKFDLADGKPILKDDPTKPIDAYFDGLKQNYPWAFKGTAASGGDAAGGRAVPSRTISAGDQKAFLANVDAIAKGEVAVQ